MAHTACWCGNKRTWHLFHSGKYAIVSCRACGQVRTLTPKHVTRKQWYAKEDFAIYLEKEKYFRELFRIIVAFVRRFNPPSPRPGRGFGRISAVGYENPSRFRPQNPRINPRSFKSRGVLVDIGAGVGLLVDEARKAGFAAIGFEPSPAAVTLARREFGIRLIPSEFSVAKLPQKPDIIVLNHVLEHLPAPRQMIKKLLAVLAPSGILAIGVPNFGSLVAKLKKDRWQSLSPEQHRWQFTMNTLDALVLPLGFLRIGRQGDNHDRSLHPAWKRLLYVIIDVLSHLTGSQEALLVVYKKV